MKLGTLRKKNTSAAPPAATRSERPLPPKPQNNTVLSASAPLSSVPVDVHTTTTTHPVLVLPTLPPRPNVSADLSQNEHSSSAQAQTRPIVSTNTNSQSSPQTTTTTIPHEKPAVVTPTGAQIEANSSQNTPPPTAVSPAATPSNSTSPSLPLSTSTSTSASTSTSTTSLPPSPTASPSPSASASQTSPTHTPRLRLFRKSTRHISSPISVPTSTTTAESSTGDKGQHSYPVPTSSHLRSASENVTVAKPLDSARQNSPLTVSSPLCASRPRLGSLREDSKLPGAPNSDVDQAPNCDNCKEKPANVFCTICGGFICHECDSVCHAAPLLQKHKRVPVNQVPKHKYLCKEHPLHNLEFFCRSDQSLVCAQCFVSGTHKGHTICDVEEVAVEFRGSISNLLNQAQIVQDSLEAHHRTLSEVCLNSEKIHTKDVDCIHKYFSHLQEELSKREEYLVAQLLTKSPIEDLQQQTTQTSLMNAGVQSVLREGRATLRECDTTLLWDKDALIKKLKKVAEIQIPSVSSTKVPVISLPVCEDVISSLGNIKMCSYKLDLGVGADGTLIVDKEVTLEAGKWHEYVAITVKKGGLLTANAWDGRCGGRLQLRVRGTIKIEQGGHITMSGKGYSGGKAISESNSGFASQGESPGGLGERSGKENQGGGGGGSATPLDGSTGGGGGGNASMGEDSKLPASLKVGIIPNPRPAPAPATNTGQELAVGCGGTTYCSRSTSQLSMGSGGGAGHPFFSSYDSSGISELTSTPRPVKHRLSTMFLINELSGNLEETNISTPPGTQEVTKDPSPDNSVTTGGTGGRGGGIIQICAQAVENHGTICCNGECGHSATEQTLGSGGGGGAGGDIQIQAEEIVNDGVIQCKGGPGGKAGNTDCFMCSTGGAGGCGQIVLEYGTQTGTGTTEPDNFTYYTGL
ncbi:hypothetical protein Pelo_8653 [Pelomyxa schiedti]|nr:hypothetical protein Pelo_8653 [Pelomyxa schiedti]